jgi:hypothetical protein
MKNKYLLILLLAGFIIAMIGSLFKIMHWPDGLPLIIVGVSLKIISIILLAVKFFNNDKMKDYLDS